MTLSPSEIITLVSLGCNILLGYLLYRGNGRRAEYDFIDSQIADILKIQLEYPNYRKEGFKPENELEQLKMDAYCCLVWNSLETMYEKYGERNLRKSSFFPAMRALAKRHKDWVESKSDSYDVKLRKFLVE